MNFRAIDFLLLTLYAVSTFCALYIIIAHIPYFRERIRAGAINLFMLAMLVFLSAYTIKMSDVILALVVKAFNIQGENIINLAVYGWTVAQLGTTFGLISLAILTRTRKFDLFIYLRKMEAKGEEPTDDKADRY